MASTQDNPNDTFWLARYAHNKLAPLFAQAKAIEPTLHLTIQETFADADDPVYEGNHISAYGHWKRDGMFLYSTWLRTKADVDNVAAKVADDVAALSARVTA